MAYTTINNPHQYFQSVLWTANGTNPRTITFGGSVDIQPDLLWYKCRSAAVPNILNDSVRGFGNDKELSSNDATAAGGQSSETDGYVSAATSDGFTLAAGSSGGDHYTNEGSRTFVAWGWKESATAGFDILTHTGTGSSNDVSHNLSAVPEIIFTKRTSATQGWFTHMGAINDYGKVLFLESNGAVSTQASAYDAAPTSSVINYGTDNGVNGNGDDYVAYLWRSVQGFSKFGSYVGNANADGPFIYTGFQPAWVMVKGDRADNWQIMDNKREGYNVVSPRLEASTNAAEYTNLTNCDFTANGFKVRSNDSHMNSSGTNYYFLAFAEQPQVNSSGIPGNAK